MEEIQTFRTQKIWPFWALLINIIIMATVIGALGHSLFLHNRNDLGLVREVREIIYENALVEVPDEQQLEYAMVSGMVDSLNDPYAVFVEPADHEIQTDQLHGNFGGIGTQIGERYTKQLAHLPLSRISCTSRRFAGRRYSSVNLGIWKSLPTHLKFLSWQQFVDLLGGMLW